MEEEADLKTNEFVQEQAEKQLELYDWQRRGVKFFFENGGQVLYDVATGSGKCFGKGTRIMMFDGASKNVEDIKVGHVLMGDDSTPRVVTSLARGREMLYDIHQTASSTYRVNESHILSLQGTNAFTRRKMKDGSYKEYHNRFSNKKCDISLKEYLSLAKFNKHILKGYKVPLDFQDIDVDIDPYWLGLWLADGHSHYPYITNPDPEVIEYCRWYAKELGLRFTVVEDKRRSTANVYCIVGNRINGQWENPLLEMMREYDLLNNKHIPEEYLMNSREKRFSLLAGLLDGDGYLHNNFFEISQKSKVLAEQIVFIARSLGFRVNCVYKKSTIKEIDFEGWYYRTSISGHTDMIPTRVPRKQATPREQKKNPSLYGIKVEPVGVGDYYGFTVEGNNRRFLLEDFTVVHNTILALEIVRRLREENPIISVLVVVPKNIILETGWYVEFKKAGFSPAEIGIFYGDYKEDNMITLTNMQSVFKLPHFEYDLVILDEVHNYLTQRMMKLIDHPFRYKIGLTATLDKMDSRTWDLSKKFKHKKFTYAPKDALADGVLNPFHFTDIAVMLDSVTRERYDELSKQIRQVIQTCGSYRAAMMPNSGYQQLLLGLLSRRKALVNNYQKKFEVARKICLRHPDKRIIIFNEFNSQTSKVYWELMDDNLKSVIVHSGVDKEQRADNIKAFDEGTSKILLTTKVLDEGYNLPKIDIAIIMAGNSTDRQTVQRMGRVLRKKLTHSVLYQVYCYDTVEERHARGRSRVLRELSSSYEEHVFGAEQRVVL